MSSTTTQLHAETVNMTFNDHSPSLHLTTTMPPPPKPTFLTIPLELRLEIYSLLLTLPPLPPPSPVYRSPPSPPRSPSPSRPEHYHAAIILTCRQTHFEATPLLYSLNTFKADPKFLTAVPSPLIDSKYIPLIRHWSIKIRLDHPTPSLSSSSSQACLPNHTPATLSRVFSNAHSLTITLWQASFMGGVGISQLARFERVRNVRRVKIQGMMPGFGRYVRWLEGQMRKPVPVCTVESKEGEEEYEYEEYEPEDEWEGRRLNGWS
ncbi:hypothetical protein QBC44DRAFT_38622 [Cladorrhinum sp. PSN332]|nr:hypothetical protein QBC44DRAFT_38622 [Cladorrhinum sp. PSN332]